MNQTKTIISGHPKAMPELSYEYMSTLVNTKPLEPKHLEEIMTLNPILLSGRLSLIQGMYIMFTILGILNSPPLIDRFQRILISV